jgi:hypothetical protein
LNTLSSQVVVAAVVRVQVLAEPQVVAVPAVCSQAISQSPRRHIRLRSVVLALARPRRDKVETVPTLFSARLLRSVVVAALRMVVVVATVVAVVVLVVVKRAAVMVMLPPVKVIVAVRTVARPMVVAVVVREVRVVMA